MPENTDPALPENPDSVPNNGGPVNPPNPPPAVPPSDPVVGLPNAQSPDAGGGIEADKPQETPEVKDGDKKAVDEPSEHKSDEPASTDVSAATYWIREGFEDPYLKRWVVDLIYTEEPGGWQFAVYLDEEFGIQWYCRLNPECEVAKKGEEASTSSEIYFPSDWGDVYTDVMQLETLSESLRVNQTFSLKLALRSSLESDGEKQVDFARLRKEQRLLRGTRRLIAEALGRMFGEAPSNTQAGLDPRSQAAIKALGVAKEYLISRSSEVGRQWTLLGALGMTVACMLILFFWHPVAEDCASTKPYGEQKQTSSPATSASSLQAAAIPKSEGSGNAAPADAAKNPAPPPANPPGKPPGDGAKPEGGGNAENHSGSKKGGDCPGLMIEWICFNKALHCSLIGALGAFLSLLMSATKRTYDAGAGRPIHIMEGCTRVLVGVLGGMFVIFGIKSRMFLGFIGQNGSGQDSDFWLILLLVFTAGLSEQLVPTFASLVEAQVQSPKKTN